MAATLRWREVAPVPEPNGALGSVLDSTDALRNAWQDWLRQVSEDDLISARHRSPRRHAIETGIIERLYDLDWGVTEALVAEGPTLDAAREGGIDTDTLAIRGLDADTLCAKVHEYLSRQREALKETFAEIDHQARAAVHRGGPEGRPGHHGRPRHDRLRGDPATEEHRRGTAAATTRTRPDPE